MNCIVTTISSVNTELLDVGEAPLSNVVCPTIANTTHDPVVIPSVHSSTPGMFKNNLY